MLRGTPASFFVMAAGVPLGVLLAWAELRLPALVVSEVTGGQTFLHAALAVGALLVLTFLAVYEARHVDLFAPKPVDKGFVQFHR